MWSNNNLKEKDICKAFYKRYQILKSYDQLSNDAFVFHIANEQNCNKFYTLELKRMGLTSGIADYAVLAAGGKIGFIEFKRNKKCKLSSNQEDFSLICVKLGIPYIIVWDIDTAINFVKSM